MGDDFGAQRRMATRWLRPSDLMPKTPAQAVLDDHGQLNEGACRAHHVSAENGEDYIIKGPSFTPEHPTVAANEWITAKVAEALGLPILPSQLLTLNGQLFFGSSWMATRATWHPQTDATLFARCENQERAYDIVVLDAWFVNRDRHRRNLIVRVVGDKRHSLMLNDHSHLLVSPLGPRRVEDLMGCLDDPPGRFVRLSFIRDSISSATALSASLDRVEGLSDAQIEGIVESTPIEFLDRDDCKIYAEFLIRRRPKLRDLFNSDLPAFPKIRAAKV